MNLDKVIGVQETDEFSDFEADGNNGMNWSLFNFNFNFNFL